MHPLKRPYRLAEVRKGITFLQSRDMPKQDDKSKIFISTIGVFISALCCHYVYTRLKLKKIIKGQLLGMCIHHLVVYINISIFMICKFVFVDFSKAVCTYGMIWGVSLYSGCMTFLSAISISRFYITWTTKNLKYPKDWIMIICTVLAIIINYIVCTIAYSLQAYLELPGLVATCNGYKTQETVFQTGWIVTAWILMVSVSGITGDLGLKRYLNRRQNEGGDIQLVPWKSGFDQSEQSKDTIPMRATLLSFLTTFLFFIGMAVNTTVNHAIEDVIVSLLLLYGCAQVPLIIALTVKLNQNKVAPQQPKQQLHFHDEPEQPSEFA